LTSVRFNNVVWIHATVPRIAHADQLEYEEDHERDHDEYRRRQDHGECDQGHEQNAPTLARSLATAVLRSADGPTLSDEPILVPGSLSTGGGAMSGPARHSWTSESLQLIHFFCAVRLVR
jgi:hypothetical protein